MDIALADSRTRARHQDVVWEHRRLTRDLGWLAEAADLSPLPAPTPEPMPGFLSDPALQQSARAAYQRDYIQFGFPDRP